MNWRDNNSVFTEYENYFVYTLDEKGIEVSKKGDEISIKNASSVYDQVMLTTAYDFKDFNVKVNINKEAQIGSKIYIGFTNNHTNEKGEKRSIVHNRGDGTFVATTVAIEFITRDKVEISFLANTKNVNWGGFKYFGRYDAFFVKQLVSVNKTFKDHTFDISLKWIDESFVLNVSDNQAVLRKDAVFYDSSSVKVTIPNNGWNNMVLSDFEKDMGYIFITPCKNNDITVKIAKAEAEKSTYIGKSNDFWSYTPVPITCTKLPFSNIPEFLHDKELCTCNMFEKEKEVIAFSKAVNIVRFLGGWNPKGATLYGTNLGKEKVSEYDLAYKDENGKVIYRFGENYTDGENLVKARLEPFVSAGYKDIRIVLDNTPYCFPKDDYMGEVYGQSALAENIDEWAVFIKDMILECIRLYGYENVKNWSFRLATEGDDYGRFSGDVNDYCKVYKIVSDILTNVLPEAKFGPYNVLNSYNHLAEVVEFAVKNNLKMDWIAASIYIEDETNPDVSLESFEADVKRIRSIVPNGEELSLEIHEYDWLSMISGYFNRIPNARGAAGNFHTMMNLKKMGTDRIYHWQIFEEIKTQKNKYTMIMGHYWLYCVLNMTENADMYELACSGDFVTGTNNFTKAIGFHGGKDYENIVIVSTYNLEPSIKIDDEIEITLPQEMVNSNPMKELRLVNETDWCYHLRKDLEKEDLLVKPWTRADIITKPYNVASTVEALCGENPRGLEIFEENHDKYFNLMRNSLVLKNSKAKLNGNKLKISVENPSVYVIVW